MGLFREDPGRLGGRPLCCVLHTQVRTIIHQITTVPACMRDACHFLSMVFERMYPIGV
jgi:hypothetical protein